jgi:hypothetical protein
LASKSIDCLWEKFTEIYLKENLFRPGVTNPNWSLDRIGKIFKYQLFGPYFDEKRQIIQNIEKSLIFDPSLGRGLATPNLDS